MQFLSELSIPITHKLPRRKTGLLIESNDVQALTSAVRSLLCDPDKAAALGRNARKIALERFDWDSRVVAQYNALYHRMASTKKSATAQ